MPYFSIAMTKCHGQGATYKRKCFIWCSHFQRVRVHDYHGGEIGCTEAIMSLGQ